MTFASVFSLLAFGVLIGVRHAFEADHVAAVAGLAARRESALSVVGQGAIWGCGHTLSLALVAGIMLALGLAIPPRLESFFELCVAIVLILLGAQLLRRMFRDGVHGHAHRHADGQMHWHFHRHGDEEAGHQASSHQHRHQRLGWGALLFGMLHGLAGSAALVLMAVERTGAESWALAMGYVFAFGFGSIFGMSLCSVAISLPWRLGSDKQALQTRISATIGTLTVCVGLWMLVGILPF